MGAGAGAADGEGLTAGEATLTAGEGSAAHPGFMGRGASILGQQPVVHGAEAKEKAEADGATEGGDGGTIAGAGAVAGEGKGFGCTPSIRAQSTGAALSSVSA